MSNLNQRKTSAASAAANELEAAQALRGIRRLSAPTLLSPAINSSVKGPASVAVAATHQVMKRLASNEQLALAASSSSKRQKTSEADSLAVSQSCPDIHSKYEAALLRIVELEQQCPTNKASSSTTSAALPAAVSADKLDPYHKMVARRPEDEMAADLQVVRRIVQNSNSTASCKSQRRVSNENTSKEPPVAICATTGTVQSKTSAILAATSSSGGATACKDSTLQLARLIF